MGIFKRKQIEKESNIASTPKDKMPIDGFSKRKFYMLLWNLVSMAFYCVYIFFIILQVSYNDFLLDVIMWLVYIYILAFFLVVVFSIGSKQKFKARMKNYKSALNFLKYFIQLVSFVLSIVTVLSTLITTGKADITALYHALFSLGLTIVMVLFEVIKIIIRRNIPVVKKNFLEIRERKEEELIKLGKKKPKPVTYNYDEEKVSYNEEQDEVENEPEEEDDDDNDVVFEYDEDESPHSNDYYSKKVSTSKKQDYYSKQFNKKKFASFLSKDTDNADEINDSDFDEEDNKNTKQKRSIFGRFSKK